MLFFALQMLKLDAGGLQIRPNRKQFPFCKYFDEKKCFTNFLSGLLRSSQRRKAAEKNDTKSSGDAPKKARLHKVPISLGWPLVIRSGWPRCPGGGTPPAADDKPATFALPLQGKVTGPHAPDARRTRSIGCSRSCPADGGN